jgi:hypothetical protein
MLLAALLFVYAWLLTFIAGHAVISWIEKLCNESAEYKHTPLIHLAGMAAIAVLVGALHLFFPVAGFLHSVVLALLALYVVRYHNTLIASLKTYTEGLAAHYLFAALILVVAVISIVARMGTGDIADYHLQAIKWAEYYPNIPGLGNFNKPLANNYWWFNLQAFFGLGFAGVRSVYCLNALLYASVTLFVYHRFRQSASKVFYLFLLLFMIFSVKTAFIGAVTTDVFINYIIFVLFALVFSEQFSKSNHYLFLLLLVFSVTVKITIVMIGALWLYSVISHWQLYKKNMLSMAGYYGALTMLFIAPWIAGNIIQSGYILPLFNHIDMLNADWKVPGKYFDMERMVITNWSKLPDEDMYVTARMALWEWVPRWFKQFDLFNKSLLIMVVISLGIFIGVSIRSIRTRQISHHFYVTLCAILSLLCMFFSSPQMRFMFGYVVVVIGLVFQFVLPFAEKWMKPVMTCATIAILTLTGLRLISIHRQYGLQTVIGSPPPYAHGLVQPVLWGNEKVYITGANNTCWDAFPCSYYVLPNTILRGKTIAEGFRNTETSQ